MSGLTYEQMRTMELRKRLAGLVVSVRRHLDMRCQVQDNDLLADVEAADGHLRMLEKGDKQ